ncbi:anti-repressor SinI family protein [Ectobacillus ponti]|nr:anti-repressor SinI family protein [Ectobacillus ponti]
MISLVRMAEEVNNGEKAEAVDMGWVALLAEAKALGLTIQEIRDFLQAKAQAPMRIAGNS